MSVTVLTIAAIHAAPVVMTGMISRHRGKVTIAAIIMGLIAVGIGGSRYGLLDLAAVIISYFFSLRLCKDAEADAQERIADSIRSPESASARANTSLAPRQRKRPNGRIHPSEPTVPDNDIESRLLAAERRNDRQRK